MGRVLTLAAKDVREFLRERRTLILMVVSAFLFPLLGLAITGFKAEQRAPVAVVVCDAGSVAEKFAERVAGEINGTKGLYAVIISSEECRMPQGYIAAIMIPKGFTANTSTLDRPVVVYFYRLVGSTAAYDAENAAWRAAWSFSQELARSRVAKLAKAAGVKVVVDNVLYPVKFITSTVTPSGAPAPPEAAQMAEYARFLAFSVFFVLNPAAIAVADAIARERELGTGELIAITPLSGFELVAGKTIAATLVAAVAAVLDLLGAMSYLGVAGFTGFWGLAAFHAVQVVLAVMVTSSITLLITLLLPGRRTATLVASMVTSVATLVFFANLFVDFTRLPPYLQAALYVIPYTHTVEAILYYSLGSYERAAIHTLILLGLTVAAIYAASKTYKPERLVKRY